MAAYDAGYEFTTGRYLPPQDADIDPNKEARFLDGRLPSGSFAKAREIYNSIYDRLTSRVA